MSPERFESEELDDDSLDYLRTVREGRGTGAPGVFLDSDAADLTAASLPGCGAGVGAVLLVLTLILMYSLLWSDSFNLALLVTGLGFLGGWLVVAWLRCLVFRGSSRYIGHFKYFDPLYLWHGTGGGVFVSPLRGVQEARCKHEYSSDGGYSSSTVSVVLEEGAFDVKIKSESLAEAVEAYLNELARDRDGKPIERGYEAARRARHEADLDEDDAEEIEAIPEPHKARTNVLWLVRYAAVIGAFVATFFVSYALCKAWKDASLAAAVLNQGPANLRIYLADKRNTGSRDEVLRQLKGFHENLALAVEKQNGEPDLKQGLAALVRAVHDSPTPVITVAFKRDAEKAPASTMEEVLGAEGRTLARSHVRRLCTHTGQVLAGNEPANIPGWLQSIGPMHNGQQLGHEIVAFGEPDVGFAMILIDCRLSKAAGNSHQVVWTVTLQGPDAPDEQRKTVSWKREFMANDAAQKEAGFRAQAEDFPKQFLHYLRNPIGPQEKP